MVEVLRPRAAGCLLPKWPRCVCHCIVRISMAGFGVVQWVALPGGADTDVGTVHGGGQQRPRFVRACAG